MNYNERNEHHRDCRIKFDVDKHEYTAVCEDGGELCCDSVTTIVENLFDKFDAKYWANKKATMAKPAQMWLDEWAETGRRAREEGTLMHDRIERFYLGEEPDAEALADASFCRFLEFAREVSLTPYRSEWRIFSERYRIAGTLDFLAYDGEHFVIYDWKRSSKLIGPDGLPVVVNRYGKCGLGAASCLPDTIYHHYALQVSLYRYILALEYDIEVSDGYLGTFHPDYSCPYVIKMPYYEDVVREILAQR